MPQESGHQTPENTGRLPWTCWGVCRATVLSPNPLSSFCSCTQCVCRNDVFEDIIEHVRACREIRDQAGDGSSDSNVTGKMMSCSAPTVVIAPYYLHCNTARGHLSSSNAQQQNPCPKVFPSVSFNLNKELCFRIIIIQLNVFLQPPVAPERLKCHCFPWLVFPASAFSAFAALPEILNELAGALRTRPLCPSCLFPQLGAAWSSNVLFQCCLAEEAENDCCKMAKEKCEVGRSRQSNKRHCPH